MKLLLLTYNPYRVWTSRCISSDRFVGKCLFDLRAI